MFPLRDDNPTEMFPLFTLGIIAATLAVWFRVQGAGLDVEVLAASVCAYGTIPADVTGMPAPDVVPLGPGLECRLGGLTWETLLTSMFLHGSWLHLLGNLWFLWIFGNNVEDSMGHLRFLVFYLLTGLVASAVHIASNPASPVPTVGASGAISAIMGAYLVLYPRARVTTLFIIIILIKIIRIPAWVLLGYWFLIQVLSAGLIPAEGGGVAFWAHVGGFAAGVLLIFPFRNPRLVHAKRSRVKLRRDQLEHGGWW